MGNWKKTFAVIWSGQFVSILTSSVVSYAIIFWLSIETGSAEVLAFSALSALMPQAVLGLFAGVWVDRWHRKRTMILADAFIACCTLFLAVLFWLDAARIGHIYLILALRSAGSAFHTPAMQASVPLLAPERELTRVAAIGQTIQSVCNIAGPALGGLLLAAMAMEYILLLDVAGAAVACLALAFVHIPDPQKGRAGHRFGRELREGLAVVVTTPGMGWLFLLSTALWFFVMPVGAMFPLMTLQHFGGDTFDMSIVEMLWSAGAVVGGAALGLRNYRGNRVLLINAMYLAFGLYLVAGGMLPPGGFVWFCVLNIAAGCAMSLQSAAFMSVVQYHIPADRLGRVLSLSFSLNLIPSAVGLLSAGFLAERVGIASTFLIAGLLICLLGFFSFTRRAMIRLGHFGRVSE